MMPDFGADRALVASRSNPQAVSTKGFDHGYEAWRPALIAFYEGDELPTKAALIRNGAPLDYLDRRAIDALRAAFNAIERKAA
jgi:hypothetical protein